MSSLRESAQRVIDRLNKEALRRNSAYDHYGMDNTPATVDADAYALAASILTKPDDEMSADYERGYDTGFLVGAEKGRPQPDDKAQPVAYEFQGRDLVWRPFMDERHYKNTVADGTWPIRALYAAPQPPAEQPFQPDWMNYKQGFADGKADAQQPPAEQAREPDGFVSEGHLYFPTEFVGRDSWLRTSADCFPVWKSRKLTEHDAELSDKQYHGLDTSERVCFYEQDFYVLSNFSSFNLRWKGITFATSEHAYHWEKFTCERVGETENDAFQRRNLARQIANADSAHEAFKTAECWKSYRRPDWDDVKVGIMRDILRAKVAQHEYVRRKLLATGDRELIENSWRDDFWGWGAKRDGQNILGKLWMEVRSELRAAIEADRAARGGV